MRMEKSRNNLFMEKVTIKDPECNIRETTGKDFLKLKRKGNLTTDEGTAKVEVKVEVKVEKGVTVATSKTVSKENPTVEVITKEEPDIMKTSIGHMTKT